MHPWTHTCATLMCEDILVQIVAEVGEGHPCVRSATDAAPARTCVLAEPEPKIKAACIEVPPSVPGLLRRRIAVFVFVFTDRASDQPKRV